MKFIYIALTSSLVSCTLQTMDRPEVPVHTTVLIRHITDGIPYKGQEKPLCVWIEKEGQKTFGNTRLFKLRKQGNLKEENVIKNIPINEIETILKERNCVYVTNLEQKYFRTNRPMIILGAFVIYKGKWPHKNKSISLMLNDFYKQHIPLRPLVMEPLDPPKKCRKQNTYHKLDS